MADRYDPKHGAEQKFPGSFLLALREAAAALGWQVARWDGRMAVCADATGKEHAVGLDNLYRRARHAPRESWLELITGFLRTIAVANDPGQIPDDLATVAGRLLPRLGPPHAGTKAVSDVWSQPLDDTDLALNLVIDFPSWVCFVPVRLMESSGRSAAEWVEQAKANLLARSDADCLPVIHEETGLRMSKAGDSYDSSRALLLDELLPGRADGFFVTVPGRDQLVVREVDRDAIAQVVLMRGFALRSYQSTPYALSPEVYWVRGGVWRRFPIALQRDQVMVEPPPEFVEVLHRLAPETRGEEEDHG